MADIVLAGFSALSMIELSNKPNTGLAYQKRVHYLVYVQFSFSGI